MELSDFFKENCRAAIAFSGGADSAYLLYAAVKSGAEVTAYYAKTAFQPRFELDDAERLARELGAEMKLLNIDVFNSAEIISNPAGRCYHCKKKLFTAIKKAAESDGYALIFDGTNASDDEGDRPGMKALRELGVRSPLRECGLTKADIRRLSKEAGLFTHDKPAYACLATRIASGEEITAEKLAAAENSESFLFGLGFVDFRVRTAGGAAKLQLRKEDLPLLLENREAVLAELKKYYSSVTLDLEARM